MRLITSHYGRMAGVFIAFALLFGIAGLILQWRQAPAAIAPVEAGAVDTARQSLLVDAAWLAQQIEGSDPPVLIDLADHSSYDQEHIPGAIHVWWQDAIDPFAETYGSALRIASNPFTLPQYAPDLGATPDEMIVVYDNSASERASRFVWWLNASGYPNAAVLDGGLAAWKGAGHATTSTPSSPKVVATPEPSWETAYWDDRATISTEELRDPINDPNVAIVDVRTPEQARDTINDTLPLGRIPGARSLPADSVMNPDGTFASPEKLATIIAPLGLDPDQEIVVYGRFGIDTGQMWLALRLTGHENLRVYDPGWQGWASDPALPIEPLP